ncbi:HIT family protein [Bacillus capparidis]|nr:HIT family protein [Bacillus capparidis]MBP1082178.1 diadenosine tetraphosphate (Ap4A) HIT family hydrolase [Bacillus capparidis]MED1096792.1 HIT family protein [Bacillus capparidis]
MIEITKLNVSTLYLNKDQTHKGRCIIAFDRHVRELFQLKQEERYYFIEDISNVAKVLDQLFHPDKINFAIYGDLVSHLHIHVVPKVKDSPEWGEAFVNSPKSKKYLSQKNYDDLIHEIKIGLKQGGILNGLT